MSGNWQEEGNRIFGVLGIKNIDYTLNQNGGSMRRKNKL